MKKRVITVNDKFQHGYHCDKGDFSCRRRQRQALLHWAYDSRKI
jgi:hypothetical protein